MSKKRMKFINLKNPIAKFWLGVLKGSTVTVISVIATFGIVIAISTFARAGSLTPPGAPAGTGDPDIQSFTGNGTWTKPAGARYVEIYCLGGGGGGSSYAGTGTSATTHTQGYSVATGNGQVAFTY